MLFHGPDFNQDGTVNASNYTVWQNNSGLIFSRADFDFWKANYGGSLGTASSANGKNLPEPSGMTLVFAVLGAFSGRRFRKVPVRLG
jgi:hypothetical protein